MYSIADLERLSGIKAHTIRMWEKRYSLFNPLRTEGNHRLYGDGDLLRLLNVARMVTAGNRISIVAKWEEQYLQEAIEALGHQGESSDNKKTYYKDEFIAAAIAFDENRLERAYAELMRHHDFETIWQTYLVPVMQRIGVLWLTKKVSPAQEHFLSYWIRKKIQVLIDQAGIIKQSRPNFLLFLPPGEFHELGLLVCQYLIKMQGLNSIYLGPNVPLINIESFEKSFKPTYLVTFVQSNLVSKSFRKFLLNNETRSTKLLLAGTLHPQDEAIVRSNERIIQIASIQEIKSLLYSLTE